MLTLDPHLPKLDRYELNQHTKNSNTIEIKQIAYVVDDLNQSMQEWHALGVSHFLVTRNAAPLTNARYRGEKAGKIVVDMAYAYLGDLQLELVEQKNTQASMYNETKHLRPGKPHHYAICVPNFQPVYQQAVSENFDVILDCGFDGLARMSYIESQTDPNLVLEVIEFNELTQPYFDEIERLWRNADTSQLEHLFSLQKLTPVGPLIKKLGAFALKKILPSRT